MCSSRLACCPSLPLLIHLSLTHRPCYSHTNSIDAEDHIVPVAFAILDAEDKDNMRWVLEQLKEAGEATPDDGFKDWLEGKMAHFLDRGFASLVVNDVLPEHALQYVFAFVICMHV